MHQNSSNNAALTGCLSQIGLLVLVASGTLMVCTLAMLMPPWVKVRCQRQQVLYWSESVEDYEVTFVGYHGLFAGREWQTDAVELPPQRSSGELFEATEYRIFWRLLIGEWVVIGLTAGSLFLFVSWRLHARPEALDAEAEAGKK